MVVELDLRLLVEDLPKTELVYWKDSYAKSFESEVVRLAPDGRKKAYLVTKSSAFHPKSGGQPSDTGTIETASGVTLDVKKVMMVNEVVAHYGSVTQGDLGKIQTGTKIKGEINWLERYSAMRKHTAGHLFDYCLEVATGKPSRTIDSWLGEPCYVTYAGKTPDESAISKAVQLEIEGIRKGLLVNVEFVSYERMLEIARDAPNIARLPESALMRIVTIEGCRPIPCGGTHVRNTKEIGEFRFLKIEKTTDGEAFRIYFGVN
jgi:Ser-tRNA(Ala) deacylase AlaX